VKRERNFEPCGLGLSGHHDAAGNIEDLTIYVERGGEGYGVMWLLGGGEEGYSQLRGGGGTKIYALRVVADIEGKQAGQR